MKCWLAIALLLFTIHRAAAAAEPAPSFDCAKAHSSAEKAICGDPWLAALDQTLAAAYQRRLKTADDKQGQAAWLRRRDADCGTSADRPSDCLQDRMQERIAELQSTYGFAEGTETCLPGKGTGAVVFAAPPVDPETNDTFSWRCDLGPHWSVTIRYRFGDDGQCGQASIWANGVKVARQAPFGHCGAVLKSAIIIPAGVKVCYLRGAKLEEHCDEFRRNTLPSKTDPYFAPGRLPGQSEPVAANLPMHIVQGRDDQRCQEPARRLSANWADDMSDLALNASWRAVTFPHAPYRPVPVAVAQFDIDNDGAPDTVLRLTWQSNMVAGDRFLIFPRASWVRDTGVVEDEEEFFAVLRRDMSQDERAHPGQGYDLADPFGRTNQHYSVKALNMNGRTVIFAWLDADGETWYRSLGDTAGRPSRIFFEVERSGELNTICSFAPPLRLGEQL